MKSESKTTVGVSGVNAGCRRTPGLAMGRCLANSQELSLLAIDYDNLATGLNWRGFCRCEVLPWSSDPFKMLSYMKMLKQSVRIDVLLPGLNIDVAIFSHISEELSRIGISTLLPKPDAIRKRNKTAIEILARQAELQYPLSCVCRSRKDVVSALSKIGCPCVLKGNECGVYPVRDKALFDYYVSVCESNFGFPIIVQEWVEGEEFSIVGLFDRKKDLCAQVSVKKIGLGDDGESWMTVSVDFPELADWLLRIVAILEWTGPIECDFLKNEKGVFLLDVNPRFPDWIDGPAVMGLNMPLAAVRLAIDGEAPQMTDIPSGTVFFKDFFDMCTPVSVNALADIHH